MGNSPRFAFRTLCAVAALSAGAVQAQALPAAQQSVRADSDDADDYGRIDKADSLWEAIGNAPPDRSFAFEGGEPWAWETRDGYRILVEDGGDGIRSYYFEPGADAPFLAVEPGMSFGFDGDELAVVYGAGGEVLPESEGMRHRNEARALQARGARMLAAMLRGQPQPVDAGAWIDAVPFIQVFLNAWDVGRTRTPGWRQYRTSDWDARALRRRLEAERLRRQGMARRFETWRAGGYQGTPSGHWRRPDAHPDRPRHQWNAGGEWHRPGQGGWERGVDQGAGPGAPRPDRNPRVTADGDAAATTDRPRRPGWNAADRPDGARRWPRTPDASASSDAADANAPRPPREPRGDGARPGWSRPPAPTVATPEASVAVDAEATPAPAPRWQRPRPAPETPASVSSERAADVSVAPPPRPRRSENDGTGWSRPAPVPAPSASSDAVEAAPPPRTPRWNRSEGSSGWARPAPSTDSGAAPARTWSRPEGGWNRPRPAPEAPAVTTQSYSAPAPSYTPPAPSYTPPVQRYSPPAPSSSPPPSPPSRPTYSAPSKARGDDNGSSPD